MCLLFIWHSPPLQNNLEINSAILSTLYATPVHKYFIDLVPIYLAFCLSVLEGWGRRSNNRVGKRSSVLTQLDKKYNRTWYCEEKILRHFGFFNTSSYMVTFTEERKLEQNHPLHLHATV